MKQYRHSIFSIRKLSIGVVSLCIGSGLLLSSLSGLQVEASERIAKSNQEIHFQYLLEEELSPEEKNRIVQNLPEELRQEATYFVVYRPHPSKVLPVTGEVVSQVAGWLAAGFLLIGIRAISSKKARVTSLLYITISGTVLPVLQIEALQSHALARFNQMVTVKAGDVLPDGKLKLDSYDFVGYIVEEGKTSDANITLPNLDNLQKSTGLDEPNLTDKEIPNSTEPSLPQVLIKYREEKIPMEMKRVVVDDSELAIGQERLEAGVAGYYLHRYEESWLGDNLQSSRLIEVIEEVGKPEILYRGTKVEELPEQPIETQVPDHAPTAPPPVLLEYELQERVDQQVLPILEERIETDRLAQGETETVEGQTGLLEITYQDVIVDGKVIASNEVGRTGTPAINRKVYVGTRVVEELPEQPIETQVPDHAPTAQPPVRLEYELQERVDQQVLPILEERIETDRLAQGETETVEGQTGLLEITYQDVIVDGKVIASNEVSRTGTPAVNRKVYVGTRVDSKEVEPLTHSIPEAIIVSEEVPIPFEREQRSDPTMAVGTSRVEAGKEGLSREIYAELNGVRTHLKSEEITPAQPEITYVGSAVDEVTEEELPLVERIVELADQYTDYILEVQAGYPGRRKTISRNGEVIRVETEEGQEKIVHIGIKPIEGTVVENLSQTLDYGTVYQADPNLAFGVRQETEGQAGQEVFEVTYRTIKGQKTEEIRRKRISYTTPVDKVITFGTQATEEEVREALPAIYEADDTIPLGQQTPIFAGREKVTVYRTTYVLDEETGQVSSQRDQGTLREVGESPIIRVGTQPKVETLREPLPVVYQADTTRPTTSEPVRQAGRDKVITLTTTYSVNPNTGEVTAGEPVRKVTDEGQSTVITVGTQATEEEVREALPAIYEADDTIPLGQKTPFSDGREKVTVYRTTYVLDEETGQVSSQRDQGTLREAGESPVIRVGTQPKVETLREPLPVVYQADTTRPTTSEPVRQAGRDKVITLTTTYSVNPNTGEVTASEPVRKVTDEGQSTVITVGTQPTVREVSQTLPTVYRAREDMEPPYRKEVVTAQERRLGYRTNYVVNPQTGERLPQAEESFVISEGRAAIIEVGTKSTVVSEKVPHQVIRQDDFTLPEGEEVEGPAGRDGSITRTTSYRLNEATGELETLSVQIVEVAAQNQVIRVGKKVEEVPPKPLEKPSVLLNTDRTGGAWLVTEEESALTVHYRVSNPDETLIGVRLDIYNGDQIVKSIEKSSEFGEEEQFKLAELQHYLPYQARLTYRYRTQDGQEEAEVATLPFEISPKSIEFRNVTSRELYRLTSENELERVTSLTEKPSDLTRYIARYKTDNQRDMLLTVAAIDEVDGQYQVKVTYPKLVQNRTSDYNSLEEADYFTVEKVVLEPGTFIDFATLVAAIKANTSGTFKIAADLVADETQENAYIPQFTGTLESVSGKNYKILNLNKPLIGTMTQATIQNIDLVAVNIVGGDQKVAALAQNMTGGKVENVRVDGKIQSTAGAAGLVHTASNATFKNVVFKGQLDLTNITDRNTTRSAGLIGDLRQSAITNAYINLDAIFNPRRSMMDQLAGVAGYSLFSQINNVYLTGKIEQQEEGSVAGIAAGEFYTQATNILTNLQLPDTANMVGLRMPLTIHATEQATGTIPATATVQHIQENRIAGLLTEWGIADLVAPRTTGTSNSQSDVNQVDYSQLQHAQTSLAIAYKNVAKLLPFYDRHTIVKIGNRIDETSSLNRSLLRSIVPLYQGRPLQNIYANKDKIEELLLYFENGLVETMAVSHIGQYADTGITEYRLGDNLLYTPDQWLLSAQIDQVLGHITSDYNGLDLESEAYAVKTKMAEFAHSKGGTFDIRQLYLKSSQEQLKANLESELASIIDRQWISDLNNPLIQSYIANQMRKEKESIWLGLTYLHRHYNIDFQRLNIQDLMKFRPNFYGQQISVLDWLKRVGSLEYGDLLTFYAPETFNKHLSNIVSTDKTLIDYLEFNRQLFSPEQSDREWFASATKAFLYAEPTAETEGRSNHVYDHIKRFERYHKYLLPILTIPEDNELTVISTANLLAFGGYGRYVDMNLAKTNPEAFKTAVKRIEEVQIPQSAALWSQFIEFWKGVISEQAKARLQDTSVLIWDGYLIKDATGTIDLSENKNDKRRWAEQFGDSYKVVDDFFGPVFKYYSYSRGVSASAEMNKKEYIDFGNTDVLTTKGDSTLSHELVHLFEDIILDLHGKRRSQDSESYALGLLQSIASSNAYYYGFNFMGNLSENANHNSQAGRLKTADDLQEYMKGSFDTTYLLDTIEMQAMLTLDKTQQRQLLRKISLVNDGPTTSNGVQYLDAIDRISELSDAEWQNISLNSLDSFVDSQLVLASSLIGPKDYLRDNIYNYYFVPLFYPIYAGLLNNQGTVGGLQFRRTALELLAEKGWQDGFIPYASDALRAEAESSNQPLSDDYIWKKVMPEYDSYASFKKARYNEMLAKQNRIKPIQIIWNNSSHQITSGQDIQNLMQVAIQADLANPNPQSRFQRQQLKEVLYKAFHEASQEFRESIFLP
ncbi:G5 domain-containing protein [Streptococcus suis]|uniref:ZmpA/ZmpB/ZmpC family metallo-endopeptidase n=1 Tax=Streptococcus suis TaxID=1307 RepID=UPI001C98ACCD|nr:ZmpA/ZmpB/ZmpC family metallo-endopeptidase [Streptococcus suis]MBY4962547.1 G5 domain-containing protein [Streptococcus suis]MBY4968870.1 G5 domain-containing protein [Streptococcus suis]MBY4979953.1 G5 domain-containing protein [Streptococcus suis]MBY4988526.1 G5 domain-containing protein [Streptococcus suis]MBY4995034.1 G5 domain-containing protein [Streptococcus suis]